MYVLPERNAGFLVTPDYLLPSPNAPKDTIVVAPIKIVAINFLPALNFGIVNLVSFIITKVKTKINIKETVYKEF